MNEKTFQPFAMKMLKIKMGTQKKTKTIKNGIK